MTDIKQKASDLLNERIKEKHNQEEILIICRCGCGKNWHENLSDDNGEKFGRCEKTEYCMCCEFTPDVDLSKALHTYKDNIREAAEEVIAELLQEAEICSCEYCDEHRGLGVYDPNFGDGIECKCGHPYYRHFDTYDNMRDVGCKYCYCEVFEEK
jgi:hypothetical protein